MRRSVVSWILTGMAILLCLLPYARTTAAVSSPLARAVAERALRKGDGGDAVVTLQQLLRDKGYEPGSIDGKFGPRTETAVRQAQKDLGLTVDGLAGRSTVAALQRQAAVPGASVAPVNTPTTPSSAAGPGDRRLVWYNAAPVTSATPELPKVDALPGEEPHLFALTFNGVPDPKLLPTLLDLLRSHGMHATFFITGETAEKLPDQVAQIARAGHEIGNNGWGVYDMTKLSRNVIPAQLQLTQQAIDKVTGGTPAFFRPPKGSYDDNLTRAARDLGLQTVLWNGAVADDPGVAPDELADRLAKTVHRGSIVMLHQDRANTVAALQPLLQQLRDGGYQSVTLSQLMGGQKFDKK